ncbi:hypothetical protein F4678DRAFT_433372 [Xylaria arbuscula]|nr:hypothetical protein F4678DRAFT_433372 [Xylaria arbuscula]
MAGKKNPAPTKTGKGASSRTTPSRDKKQSPLKTATQTIEKSEAENEIRREQTLLNIFSSTFREVLEAENFSSQLQEVKTALFNRDFEGAFAREAFLDVYAARWSPTRALCYGQILRGLDSHLRSLAGEDSACGDPSYYNAGDNSVTEEEEDTCETSTSTRSDEVGNATSDEAGIIESGDLEESKAPSTNIDREENEREAKTQPLRILAIGGAAAEAVAFADYISSIHDTTTPPPRADLTLLDIGPWGSIVSKLQNALTSTPPLSRYASAAAQEANKPLVASASFQSIFVQKDILSLPQEELAGLLGGPTLISLLFTLNELYTASGIKRTTSFLRLLSTLAHPGTLLLVVDSPGSYSEAAVGKEAKRYPMQWLLDHTLVPPPSNPRKQTSDEDDDVKNSIQKQGVKWEKIESHDSVWFRVAEGLRYPIPLENMRYQMHLYRASAS